MKIEILMENVIKPLKIDENNIGNQKKSKIKKNEIVKIPEKMSGNWNFDEKHEKHEKITKNWKNTENHKKITISKNYEICQNTWKKWVEIEILMKNMKKSLKLKKCWKS